MTRDLCTNTFIEVESETYGRMRADVHGNAVTYLMRTIGGLNAQFEFAPAGRFDVNWRPCQSETEFIDGAGQGDRFARASGSVYV